MRQEFDAKLSDTNKTLVDTNKMLADTNKMLAETTQTVSDTAKTVAAIVQHLGLDTGRVATSQDCTAAVQEGLSKNRANRSQPGTSHDTTPDVVASEEESVPFDPLKVPKLPSFDPQYPGLFIAAAKSSAKINGQRRALAAFQNALIASDHPAVRSFYLKTEATTDNMDLSGWCEAVKVAFASEVWVARGRLNRAPEFRFGLDDPSLWVASMEALGWEAQIEEELEIVRWLAGKLPLEALPTGTNPHKFKSVVEVADSLRDAAELAAVVAGRKLSLGKDTSAKVSGLDYVDPGGGHAHLDNAICAS
jgi:hypothetical protein